MYYLYSKYIGMVQGVLKSRSAVVFAMRHTGLEGGIKRYEERRLESKGDEERGKERKREEEKEREREKERKREKRREKERKREKKREKR